jgi:hypothetical protein
VIQVSQVLLPTLCAEAAHALGADRMAPLLERVLAMHVSDCNDDELTVSVYRAADASGGRVARAWLPPGHRVPNQQKGSST